MPPPRSTITSGAAMPFSFRCCRAGKKLASPAQRYSFIISLTKEGLRRSTSMSQIKTFDENNLRRAFEIGLILKGIFALLEIFAGIVAYFIEQNFLLNLVLAVFHDELKSDPHDFVANILVQAAQNF